MYSNVGIISHKCFVFPFICIAFITRISIRSILGSWMHVKYKRASFQATKRRIMEVKIIHEVINN
jgi:hypothetical protein